MMADALETDFEVEATIEIDVASYDDTDGVFTDATIEDLAEPIVIETVTTDPNYSVKVVTEEGFEDLDNVTVTDNGDDTYTVTAETSHLSMFVLVSGEFDHLSATKMMAFASVISLLI
jgi:hypothetical protein